VMPAQNEGEHCLMSASTVRLLGSSFKTGTNIAATSQTSRETPRRASIARIRVWTVESAYNELNPAIANPKGGILRRQLSKADTSSFRNRNDSLPKAKGSGWHVNGPVQTRRNLNSNASA